MISDYEEEDEEVVFQRLSLSQNYPYSRGPKDQHMRIVEEDCAEEEIDIYQQLAEKDHYLILAAEAGKVLLEKNQELTKHFESLQEEYLQKIEGLEQDRHYLRKELNERGVNYESRMQELQNEISNLGGQLQVVQKSSRTIENSTQSTYDSLVGQNSSLHYELDKVKAYNNALTQQVELLTGRIDEQQHGGREKYQGDKMEENDLKDEPLSANGGPHNDLNFNELLSLKERVKHLTDQKDFLEESLNELVKEKYASGHEETDGKVSTLEEDVSNLRQQMIMCQEELQLTRRKNEHLKDQLEEYVLMQSSQTGSHLNTSLLNELELSIPEVDMNFRCMSTPMKSDGEVNGIADVPIVQVPQNDTQAYLKYEKLRKDLQEVYIKLRRVKSELTNDGGNEDFDLHLISGEHVTKLVDEVIDLIHHRTMALSLMESNGVTQCQLEIDNCDNISQPDSQTSDRDDRDTDILEQQVHDLNQRLNITTFELEKVKRELVCAQTTANESKDKADALTVKTNCQEREVENLRSEREILLNDKTMDDNLKKALEDRDEALRRENDIKAKYETAQSDMKKLNDQLIAAVQQKLELSEQLEQWQFDMAQLIDQQLSTKVKRDNQKSRKRTKPTTNPARSFAAKLFTNKSKDTSRS